MSFTTDQATRMAELFGQLADEAPCRQVRFEMARRAKEWQHAAKDSAEADAGGVIELAGVVTPGMVVFRPSHRGDWMTVVRKLEQGGQFSLHLEDDDGRPVYANLWGPTSPVVVAT